MGFEIGRFQNTVDEELICPICSGVLDEPVQGNKCEHTFCRACIREWLRRQCTCPVDRKHLTISDLRPVPRILRNMLSRLSIVCDNVENGCQEVMKLDRLQSHLRDCVFDPDRPIPCSKGCGCIMKASEMSEHNCFRELRALINKEDKIITEMKSELAQNETAISELKRELEECKEMVRIARLASPRVALSEGEELIRWTQSLVRARVLRWGGMISTPDDSLKMVIRHALSDFGCPSYLLDPLMQNCHERQWPRGLLSLESRQSNRALFENYVCRRVPLNQAIVVLAHENEHMAPNLIVEPGMVMIFAHGIVDM